MRLFFGIWIIVCGSLEKGQVAAGTGAMKIIHPFIDELPISLNCAASAFESTYHYYMKYLAPSSGKIPSWIASLIFIANRTRP